MFVRGKLRQKFNWFITFFFWSPSLNLPNSRRASLAWRSIYWITTSTLVLFVKLVKVESIFFVFNADLLAALLCIYSTLSDNYYSPSFKAFMKIFWFFSLIITYCKSLRLSYLYYAKSVLSFKLYIAITQSLLIVIIWVSSIPRFLNII